MKSNVELAQQLKDLFEGIESAEALLKDKEHKDNPFSCQWHDTNKTRGIRMDGAILKQWKAEKVKLAKTYVKLAKRQIAIVKKELGVK